MSWAGEPDVVVAIGTALEHCSSVASVTLGGSRARGGATALSDWDLYLKGDPEAMMVQVPEVIACFGPLAAFWEPLAADAGYMVVLDGPTKVDVFPTGGRRRIQPPWVLTAETLVQIDGHFWDWSLWLGGKSLRGERDLVADELMKMHDFLLAPIGVVTAPTTLGEALAVYLQARASATSDLGVFVDPELGRQVSDALQRHRVIGRPVSRPGRNFSSERMALPTTIGEQMPNARDVVLKHIDAFNGRDSDAEPWAADAEFTAPGAQVSGRDDVIGFIAVFQEAFPDLRLEIEQLLTDGPAAAAEGIMTGTHDGVLHTPDGDVAPTGRALALRWAAVYAVEGDTLKSEHLFFDQMDFLGQLGLLPG